jgi:hypothetical protein
LALGARATAYRLLALQGVGSGLILAGVVPLVASDGAREVAAPFLVTAISGLAVAASSWLGDVYGTAVPPEARGEPERRAPQIEAELGYRYVHQPAFRYRSFAVEALDLRYGAWRLRPSAWCALGDANSRLRALGSYRYLGPRAAPAPAASDGSFLDLELGLTRHRFASERFTVHTGEVFARGRLDLERYDAALAGAFTELGFGLGLEHFQVDGEAARAGATQALPLPLVRFGFGVYLGRSSAPRGELTAYYDQRHDGYEGGLAGPAAGFPGHFGLEARALFGSQLGLGLDLVAGAAYVAGLSLLVRSEVAP